MLSKAETALDRCEAEVRFYEGEQNFPPKSPFQAVDHEDLRAVCAALRAAMKPVRGSGQGNSPLNPLGYPDGRAAGVRVIRQRIRAELAKAEERHDG